MKGDLYYDYKSTTNNRWLMVDCNRLRSKVKSDYYPFRDIKKFTFTFHAALRMMQRQVSIEDIEFILQYGRALLKDKDGNRRVYLFLVPGEIPKGKAEQKRFQKLRGHVVIAAYERPLIITLIKDWYQWHWDVYARPVSGQLYLS